MSTPCPSQNGSLRLDKHPPATLPPPNPTQVNVGRAGAANLDVIQEVEYVKEEDKLGYLLDCLQVGLLWEGMKGRGEAGSHGSCLLRKRAGTMLGYGSSGCCVVPLPPGRRRPLQRHAEDRPPCAHLC